MLSQKKSTPINTRSVGKYEGVMAEWCLVAILLGYPFSATISILLGVTSTPISMAYRAGYLLLALAIILIELLTSLQRKRSYSIYLVPLILFWIVYVVRMYHDFYIVGFNEGYAAKGFMFYFQYGFLGSFLPAVAIGMVVKKIDFERLFNLIRKVSMPVAACLFYIVNHEYGLGIEIFLSRFSLGGDDEIINPIILSQYGGFIAVIAFYALCYRKITVLGLVLWLAGLVLLIMGASRGPLVAVLITHLLIIIYIVKKRFKSLKLWGNVSLVAAFLIAGIIIFIIPIMDKISLFARVESSIKKGNGTDERTVQWTSAWNQFIDSPIVGDLIVERARNFYPHNLLLEILMSTGIIGGGLFLILFLKSTKNYFIIKDQYKRFVFYIAILHFTYAMFSLGLISIPQFWCSLVLLVCLNITQKRNSLT